MHLAVLEREAQIRQRDLALDLLTPLLVQFGSRFVASGSLQAGAARITGTAETRMSNQRKFLCAAERQVLVGELASFSAALSLDRLNELHEPVDVDRELFAEVLLASLLALRRPPQLLLELAL